MVEVMTHEMYGGEEKKKALTFKFIKWKHQDGQARLTLNRPPHNVLNAEMLSEIAIAFESLSNHPEIKVVVMLASSESKSFCGGVDLPEYTQERVFQMLDAFRRVFVASVEIGKPLVIGVGGAALGGGCELAVFGDIVIATPNAKFGQPELKVLGMFPPFATSLFPQLIGPKRAMELILTGNVVTAEEAVKMGLVSRVVPPEQLAPAIDQLATQLAQSSAPVMAITKRPLYEGLGMNMMDSLAHAHNLFLNELYKLDDAQEGLRALAEKRKPEWKNK